MIKLKSKDECKEFLKLKPIVNNGTYEARVDAIKFNGIIIETEEWGAFRVRKNGRVAMRTGNNEVVRCTPIKK